MGADEVVSTKLDILIDDFKEFKIKQEKANDNLMAHIIDEEKVVSAITTTLTWHTIIGTFMVGVIVLLIYLESGIK